MRKKESANAESVGDPQTDGDPISAGPPPDEVLESLDDVVDLETVEKPTTAGADDATNAGPPPEWLESEIESFDDVETTEPAPGELEPAGKDHGLGVHQDAGSPSPAFIEEMEMGAEEESDTSSDSAESGQNNPFADQVEAG